MLVIVHASLYAFFHAAIPIANQLPAAADHPVFEDRAWSYYPSSPTPIHQMYVRPTLASIIQTRG
jgi:hypothetical protein